MDGGSYNLIDHHGTHAGHFRPRRRHYLPNRRAGSRDRPCCDLRGLLASRSESDLPGIRATWPLAVPGRQGLGRAASGRHPTRLRILLPRFTCSDDGCEVTIFRQHIDPVAALR